MVQFNLLPDIKMQFIKTQRTKHVVTFVATVAGLAAVGLLVFSMLFVYVFQVQLIKSYSNSIKESSKQLKETKDITKMLTVQNQLNVLPTLHDGKPVSSRAFSFIQETTPSDVNLNKMTLDYITNTITLGGTAPSLDSVKVYANALKTAEFSVGDSTDGSHAFSKVVLASFSRDTKGANFTITAKFDTKLFDVANDVQLSVKVPTADTGQTSPFDGGTSQ